MYFSIIKYLLIFHLILRKVSISNEDVESEYPQVVQLVLLPDRQTNQKTTKVCSGVIISHSHILTSANCPDSVRKNGPNAMISKISMDDLQSERIYHLQWLYHKYFDGKTICRDLAIVKIRDPEIPKIRNLPVSVYSELFRNNCYTLGSGMFNQTLDDTSRIKGNPLKKTRMKVIREELADGSSTDIFVQNINDSDIPPLDLGSPLICHQTVGNEKYSAVIGIFQESLDSNMEMFRFRSARGLLTWISNNTEGVQILQNGILKQAKECEGADCDMIQVTEDPVDVDMMEKTVDMTNKTVDMKGKTVGMTTEPVDLTKKTVDMTEKTMDLISKETIDMTDETVDIMDRTLDMTSEETMDMIDETMDMTENTAKMTERNVDMISKETLDMTDETIDMTEKTEDIMKTTMDLMERIVDMIPKKIVDMANETVDMTEKTGDREKETEVETGNIRKDSTTEPWVDVI